MKIKLLRLPRYCKEFETLQRGKSDDHSEAMFLPPIALSVLTGYLRENGIEADQDDLLIKTFYDNLVSEDKIDLSVFNNEQKIKDFVTSGSDSDLEREGEKILKQTEYKDFDVIGFSLANAFSPSVAGVAVTLAKLLKENTNCKIIYGGSIVEEVAKYLLKTGYLDAWVTREGEHKLLTFCQALESGEEIEKIPGVVVCKDGEIRENPIQERSVFVKPTFDGLPLDLYRPKMRAKIHGQEYEYSILVLPYFFMRDCPNPCVFCDNSGAWRKKGPEEAVKEIKELSEKYRTNYFFLNNTTVNPTYNYTLRFIEALKKADINILWTDCANFWPLDEELLTKLGEVGATRLAWGIESASMRILRSVKKPLPSIEHAGQMLRLSHELGIWNIIDFITGFPYETEEDVKETIEFAKRNRKYIQEATISKLRPEGDMRKNPEKYGIRLLEMRHKIAQHDLMVFFEEINGLKWKEKAEQIYRYSEMIGDVLDPLINSEPSVPQADPEHLCFMHYLLWWGRATKGWNDEEKIFSPEWSM